jgi:hypothetical protein
MLSRGGQAFLPPEPTRAPEAGELTGDGDRDDRSARVGDRPTTPARPDDSRHVVYASHLKDLDMRDATFACPERRLHRPAGSRIANCTATTQTSSSVTSNTIL